MSLCEELLDEVLYLVDLAGVGVGVVVVVDRLVARVKSVNLLDKNKILLAINVLDSLIILCLLSS